MIVVRLSRPNEKKNEACEPLNALLEENINSIHNVEQMVNVTFFLFRNMF